MKRFAIITTVLVAHLVVLVWFIRGCQYDSIDNPDAGQTARSEDNDTAVGKQMGTDGSESDSGSDVADGGGSCTND